MARKPRAKKGAVGDNSINPTVLKSVLSKYDGIMDKMASEKGAFMKRMQVLQSEKKDALAEAKNLGIPLKPLKVSIKVRDLGRKIVAAQADLEPEDEKHKDLILDAMREFEEAMAPTVTTSSNDSELADELAAAGDEE